MSLMDLLDNVFGTQQKTPARKFSHPYDYDVPAIAVGATFRFSAWAHVPAIRQYLPINFCEIYNNSGADLRFRIESEGGEAYNVAAGASRILRVHFNNLIITNIGANALAAGECKLTLQRAD